MGHIPGRRKDEGGGLRAKGPIDNTAAEIATSPQPPDPVSAVAGGEPGIKARPIGTLYVEDFRYRKRFSGQTRVLKIVQIV